MEPLSPYRRNREAGLCGFCSNPAAPGSTKCAVHAEHYRQINRAYRDRKREREERENPEAASRRKYLCRLCGDPGHTAKTCNAEGGDDPVQAVSRILSVYFQAEPWKIGAWLLTKNPFLGDVEPASMLLEDRGEKLVQWMRHAIRGELP